MNTQKIIRSFFIIVLSSLLGIGLLFIPNIDKRLIALIGMVIFAIFFYGIFLTNSYLLFSTKNNTRKTGLLGGAVVYYLIFYFWLYPTLVEIGLSYT